MSPNQPRDEDPALAAYREACRVRRELIVKWHAAFGTYTTAKFFGISRQSVQAHVKKWKKEQAAKAKEEGE